MKIIDNNGKIGGKVSIVDCLVVVLIAACVAAVGLKMRTAQSVRGGDRTIEYQMRIEGIRDLSITAIKQNSTDIEDAETGYALGEIVDVAQTPARILVQTNDGNFKLEEYDNRYDVIVTMRTNGTETDDGYYASSGKQISVGETLGVNNGFAEFFGEVISVEVTE